MNTRTSFLAVALALLATACSRDFPPNWSSSSPVSTEAEAAAPAPVSVALDADPPLPGEVSEGWIGLEQPAEPEPDPHAHHGHHASPPAAEPEPAHHDQPQTPAHEGHRHGH